MIGKLGMNRVGFGAMYEILNKEDRKTIAIINDRNLLYAKPNSDNPQQTDVFFATGSANTGNEPHKVTLDLSISGLDRNIRNNNIDKMVD